MKTIQCVQNFKKVSNKDSAHYGQKREPVEWNFEGVEPSDIPELDANKLAVIINDSLEKMAKQWFIENSENWDYVPDSKNVSIDMLHHELTSSETRKRKVTKETLAACASFYESYAGELLGKESGAVTAGAMVIREKLVPIAANTAALDKFSDTILEFIDAALAKSADNIDIAEKIEANVEVLEWITKKCGELSQAAQVDIADSL